MACRLVEAAKVPTKNIEHSIVQTSLPLLEKRNIHHAFLLVWGTESGRKGREGRGEIRCMEEREEGKAEGGGEVHNCSFFEN